MQPHKFTTGGGVVHRIPYNGNRMSAWFDAAGNVLDVEVFRGQRAVRSGSAARIHAKRFSYLVK